MFNTEEEKTFFLDKYGISKRAFQDSMLSWKTLDEIATDYNNLSEHRETVKKYAEVIQGFQGVHSLRYREKDVEHLIEKIIRKNAI